jgi:hypothetical protein
MSLWEHEPMSFEAFGVQVELTLGDPELETDVREILPPGWRRCVPGASAGRFGLWQTGDDAYDVTVHGDRLLQHGTLAVALTMLDAQIRLFIAARTRDWVFVHAGVVAYDGRALLIPGESFSGKTTLVAALVEAGATYYSDEYAVLDDAGLVHPYLRPLSIRSGYTISTQERDAAELGEVAGEERAELGAVAITRYQPGVEWKPKRLSTGQGIVALLANTVPAQERPEQSLRALRHAMSGATVLEGDRGEAAPIASALLVELTRSQS